MSEQVTPPLEQVLNVNTVDNEALADPVPLSKRDAVAAKLQDITADVETMPDSKERESLRRSLSAATRAVANIHAFMDEKASTR